MSTLDTDRDKWARAHLLPITVPADVPELAVLSQDRDEILAGIRSGFAAAYDALAPTVGLQAGAYSLDGMKVAELVFPEVDAPHASVLEKQYHLAGTKLGKSLTAATEQDIMSASTHAKQAAANADLSSAPRPNLRSRSLLSVRRAFSFKERVSDHAKFEESTSPMPTRNDSGPSAPDVDTMFSFLPGVQLGSFPMVAERFQTYLENHSYFEG
mmetsp:Transcript_15970/g.34555  ORF Transcript_15970/g.34555 Transcript_15970/m.34555 type:complete len:213 (-) Transcript_15970:104-742(-)